VKKLRSWDTPKGDFTYKQPETGMDFKAQHPNALWKQVFDHRMSLPDLKMDVTGGSRERFWDEWCRKNEHTPCDDTEDPGRYANLSDVFAWLNSMKDWALKGFDIVPQEEAERRGAICITCPHNRAVNNCLGCHGAGDAISKLIGGRTTSMDGQLHQCAVCHGCMLGPKVFLPLEVIDASAYQESLPSFCWLKKPVE
jgi:hypothetical protein